MYYIWTLDDKMQVIPEASIGHSTTLQKAKMSARIAAFHGKHHHAVTRSQKENAEILRVYQKKTGKRIYPKP